MDHSQDLIEIQPTNNAYALSYHYYQQYQLYEYIYILKIITVNREFNSRYPEK